MAEPTPYYIFTGEAAYDNFGETMAPAGDIDNDGFDDIIIGASRHDGAAVNTGRVYVFSGRTGDTLHIFDGEASLDEFGTAVSGAGDVDNDGYADIIIGVLALTPAVPMYFPDRQVTLFKFLPAISLTDIWDSLSHRQVI